ncbi:DUF4142 domain-containing protein [Hymenobacter sp. BT175]|uniref:DUF4142 domain-containing protein n=1 Tax=Hymenobacter translucens TaxID=2886507 RepID=UPI001D0E2F39|nr:DUF4142 domain-containing protein [Hymenobacter translucens]MCC2545865.1 DUF4142 domain-containing protein [Hymenobacter translucens]
MKTTRIIIPLLFSGVLGLSAACSSTSSTSDNSGNASNSTSGSAAGANSPATDAIGQGGTVGTDAMGLGANQGTLTNAAASGGDQARSGATDSNSGPATYAELSNMPDAQFLLTAASSNMLEIQLGKLAVQQGGHAEVKKFGQMMVDHHTRASNDMKPIATQLNVTPPTTLMPMHQAMMDKLSGLSGKAFDEAYMDIMESAHTMDITMFSAKGNAAETPVVKSFAAKTLPMLRSHMKMAADIEKKVD